MCTAIKIKDNKILFGRTLDVEASYGEKIVITKRNYRFEFLNGNKFSSHHAIIGIGCVFENYPLYFDAANERGVAVAALSFPGNAIYNPKDNRKCNVASFEFIPWILCNCDSVADAKKLINGMNITDDSFSSELSPSPLHFIVCDKKESITVESLKEGIKIYENPFEVLTNNPPFDYHVAHSSAYMYLSPEQPQNNICPSADLKHTSGGMGAFGMPGYYSSQSRFIRAVFMKNHIRSISQFGDVSGFFHVMDSVSIPYGCLKNGDGQSRYTVYTSCVDMESSTYYFTTYGCRRIQSVSLFDKGVNGELLETQEIVYNEDINSI